MNYGYPTKSQIDTFLAARGIEPPDESNENYFDQFGQFMYAVINAMEWSNPLGVWLPSATTFNVRGGKYVYKDGAVKTYTAGAAVDPVDNDTTYIWLKPDNTIASAIDGTGWPATEHIKLAEIDVDVDGKITKPIRDLRGQSFLVALGSNTASGITTGQVACKRADSATVKALLDTTIKNLFSVNKGDLVLKVVLQTKTAAGAACLVDVGLDAAADGSGADEDGFLVDSDVNAVNIYIEDGKPGVYHNAAGHVIAADGNVTLTSSTDQSASSWVGGAYMIYIPV